MKKFFKVIVYVTMLLSLVFMALSVWTHTTNAKVIMQILLMVGGGFGAFYALIRCTIMQARKIRNGSSNTPMWTCLGFFIIEVALAAACIYLLFHIWSVRDLLNAELATLLSGAVVYWLTHCQKKVSASPKTEKPVEAEQQ